MLAGGTIPDSQGAGVIHDQSVTRNNSAVKAKKQRPSPRWQPVPYRRSEIQPYRWQPVTNRCSGLRFYVSETNRREKQGDTEQHQNNTDSCFRQDLRFNRRAAGIYWAPIAVRIRRLRPADNIAQCAFPVNSAARFEQTHTAVSATFSDEYSLYRMLHHETGASGLTGAAFCAMLSAVNDACAFLGPVRNWYCKGCRLRWPTEMQASFLIARR